ncbi:HAMP domain-containing sensor histidine kinase [Autumnicola edwardsiae]|uniref:histidine kinase n=1 Tax=Autumnicola edwardsiae TaxID=3075594 RepID=A0ABU3CSL7_9FLAO|nr:HAMP domain-containing sensor histidine kinase [Zunongwangia sp. F297]MDT0649357.1 HAMP domain-containing sensor histidine kinase [Zunongwangia sp. F297]
MKLLNYTTKYFAGILFLLLTLWAVLFYFAMLDEIYDSMDDGLENQKILVIQRAAENPVVLAKNEFGDGYYTIKKVRARAAKNFKESYRDTLMYMQNEEDFEPVRLLETVFYQNGEYFKLKVITSMVEEDDLVEDLLFSLLWLYFGLIVTILILNNIVLKKIWNPFYKLIDQLKNFNIERSDKIAFEKTPIEEFHLLNKSIERLLQKSVDSYVGQKQFIENASHELQTPLAISINKLELLFEKTELEEEEITILASVLNNLERLTRFNKSLLLLSRIENQQFAVEEKILINEVIFHLKDEFKDLLQHKGMEIQVNVSQAIYIKMNRDLAVILFTNLLKNAIVHSDPNTNIEIEIGGNRVNISNLSSKKKLDKKHLFSRFYKLSDNKNSSGLGVAIAKAIADEYDFSISYNFDDRHQFIVEFYDDKS